MRHLGGRTFNVRQPDGKDEEYHLFGAEDNVSGTVRSSTRPYSAPYSSCVVLIAVRVR